MSFAAADCLGGSNPLLQFNKHTQQDRSLQHQHQGTPMAQGAHFKNDNTMNARDRANMELFASSANSFQFQPMRHELNAILARHPSPQMALPPPLGQIQAGRQWSNEFALPVMDKAVPSVAGAGQAHAQWGAEFNTSASAPAVAASINAQPVQGGQSMGFNSYLQGRMYRPPLMMALHNAMATASAAPVQQHELKVDWDNQFKEIEALQNQADKEVELAAEETVITDANAVEDEIVIDDKYQATFQEVWDSLNLDAIENDFINQQYEDFNKTRGKTSPPDMAQWERDFAKYALTRAHFGDYRFEEKQHNQFLDGLQDQDPYEIGLQLMESGAKLSEAALAFEAAIQKDNNHVNAWLKLGEVQTQNEKEIAGISALEKCLELAPENLEALMTLAISYINEGYDNAAFATLERWISTKYPQISDKARAENPSINDEDRFLLNKRVTELFLKAAQLSPTQANMDPDVQMGLGVLFYANEDFDKTIDCFKAALTIKPDDPVLWNRLGASLANSNRSEEAVDAYFKALEIKPTFVRARYNLGVSCINIGCYKEAVEHLLSGLLMHEVEGMEPAGSNLNNNQSLSLMETLKRAFIAMERRDLVELVKPGMDLNQFRSEFNF